MQEEKVRPELSSAFFTSVAVNPAQSQSVCQPWGTEVLL